MNCPECRTPVEKGAQFCPKCYARIEPPSLWQRFLSLFQSGDKPRKPFITIKRTVNIKTTDKEGHQHEYQSLDQVPPELRGDIEKLESEAEKAALSGTLSGKTFRIEKKVSVFRVKDAYGKEQVYHSMEELPPEIRAAFEKAKNQIKE